MRAEARFCLLLDYEEHIAGEYIRNIEPRGMVFLWWQRILSRQGLRHFVSGRLIEKTRKALLRVGFEGKDMPYVAVAQNGHSDLIVHEDRGFCAAEAVIRRFVGARCLHPQTFNSEVDAGSLP
jgi:hypothetical protein